jgi:hypothetical protein
MPVRKRNNSGATLAPWTIGNGRSKWDGHAQAIWTASANSTSTVSLIGRLRATLGSGSPVSTLTAYPKVEFAAAMKQSGCEKQRKLS